MDSKVENEIQPAQEPEKSENSTSELEKVPKSPRMLKLGGNSDQNHHSGGDESEEYESANEGDTDGEAAAVDEAAAASKSLVVAVPVSPSSTVVNECSPSIENAFTTPPTASSQQNSPDKDDRNCTIELQQQFSQVIDQNLCHVLTIQWNAV